MIYLHDGGGLGEFDNREGKSGFFPTVEGMWFL